MHMSRFLTLGGIHRVLMMFQQIPRQAIRSRPTGSGAEMGWVGVDWGGLGCGRCGGWGGYGGCGGCGGVG